jgi:hypothetical protein
MTEHQHPARLPAHRPVAGRSFELPIPYYVYLAVHSAGQRFKIGLSNDPLRRFARLPEAHDIDLETSVARRLPTRARASEVERSLHRALAPFRLAIKERGDGYTEWFSLEAYARAVAIIDAMPDMEAPCESLAARDDQERRSRRMLAAEANVGRALASVAMWRQARRLMGLSVVDERGKVRLVLKNFRATSVNAGAGLRASLLDLEGMYRLQGARNTRVHPSLVRLLAYDGATASDLRIDLQDWAVLRRLPGGDRLVQVVRDGIELIRIEIRFVTRKRAPLSPEAISDGMSRLLERRRDEPNSPPSLWD